MDDEIVAASAEGAAYIQHWYEVAFPASPEGRLVAAFGWTARSEYLTWEQELFGADELGIELGEDSRRGVRVRLGVDTSTTPHRWVLRLTEEADVDHITVSDVVVREWMLCGSTMPAIEVADRAIRALQILGPQQEKRRHRAAFLHALITWATIIGRPELAVDALARLRAEHGKTPGNQFKVVSTIERSAFADAATIAALRRTYDPYASA